MGVDEIEEEAWPAVDALLQQASFFFVRDRASREALRNHPHVGLTPDLTFARPWPTTAKKEAQRKNRPLCGVNLRQTPRLDPRPWIDQIQRLPLDVRGVPLSSFALWAEHHHLRQLDANTPESFHPELYSGLDFFIGTAYHSILFALQAGVPAIAIDYAPKVRHFMQDVGLERYLLAPHESHKLPHLVAEVWAQHTKLAEKIQNIARKLHQQARHNMATLRKIIEQHATPQQRTGAKVTLAVLTSGEADKDRRTIASCRQQTYDNIEILLVEEKQPSQQLVHILSKASGQFVTWLQSGDWLARDAVATMLSVLVDDESIDLLYTDYYAMDMANLPVGRHIVPGPRKMFRLDVVGPGFLVRRTALEGVSELASLTSPYQLWLRLSESNRLRPFHAPLCYAALRSRSHNVIQQERNDRRCWRQKKPIWQQLFWRMVDSAWGEKLLIRPGAWALAHVYRRRDD
jgi:hypothetical protein